MNEQNGLPRLSDESIADMEQTIFDRIVREPRAPLAAPAEGHRRRRRWATALGVAAAFAAGALIAPPLLNGLGSLTPGGAGDSAAVAPAADGVDAAPRSGQAEYGGDAVDASEASGGAVAPRDDSGGTGADLPFATLDDTREIIVTAEMSLRVSDVTRTASDIAALAAEHDGFVESASLGLDPSADGIAPEQPREAGTGWISIRIPAADVNEVMDALGADAEVLRSTISRDDVTSTAVDLRARIASARTSVERLTELMSRSGSVADLIAAESALSERQAQLESYEQQLETLDEQVALSTISIQLTERTSAADPDPAGFGDGLLAGWNGLVASMNGFVVVLGFLLPWLGVAAIALLVIWLIRRRRRGRTAD